MQNLQSLLNPKQYEAVTSIEGPSLILAGAGSGKTRVITYKIIHMIETGINPERILAVTFTNKAAREMKERVASLLGNRKKQVMVTTFHSLGVHILKRDIDKLGYRKKFSIYDDKDSQKVLKDIIHELKIPDDEFDYWDLAFTISHIKMNRNKEITDERIRAIYTKYQEYLNIYNAVDFDDLIRMPIMLLETHPEVLAKYRKKWQYVLVDEYQDTSVMQYKFIKLLTSEHRNLSIVGDDDQSIYSWRGASPENMGRFESDFRPIKEVRLEQNYRSTNTILSAANAVILNNTNRKVKKLWTDGVKGEKIGLYTASCEETEADYVTFMINDLLRNGYDLSDFGILFRMNSQSRVFEEKFREADIPHKMIGAMNFFDRPEIRDILAYIRFLANENDEVALHRIINNPKRHIGITTVMKIMKHARSHNAGMYSTIKDFVRSGYLGPKTTPWLDDFVKLIEKYREMVHKPKNISRSITSLVEEIDYKGKLIQELKVVGKIQFRLNNIKSLIHSIYRYENDPDNFDPSLYEYLQKISLKDRDEDDDDNVVNMMSIHAAKGLEFKVVFVVGLEEDLLPHAKTIEETGTAEEERRLFYVAITRAREKLYFSFPETRTKFNETLQRNPSVFIDEVPEELLEELDLEEVVSKTGGFGDLLKKWNS